jgi:GGDEF domain-containing protein
MMNQMSRRVGEMLDAETERRRRRYDELTGLVNSRGNELRLTELLEGDLHFAQGAVVALEVDRHVLVVMEN